MKTSDNSQEAPQTKGFSKQLILISLPILLQELIGNSAGFIDIQMLGRIDEYYSIYAVNALALSNRLFFLFIILTFGVNSGSAVFMGQFSGKNEPAGIHKAMGVAFTANMFIATTFFLIAQLAPAWFMNILTSEPTVIEFGVSFLRIISFSYFLASISMLISFSLRSMKQTRIPMIATFCNLTVKIFLNILFIFVLDMGIIGVAIATVIGRLVEITVQITFIKIKKIPVLASPSAYFAFDKAFLKKFAKVVLPVILNEGGWAFGIFVIDIQYQFTGNLGQSAFQVADSINLLFLSVGNSLGVGTAIIMSNKLGEGDLKGAAALSKKCIKVGALVTIGLAIILASVAQIITETYTSIPIEAQMMARNALYVMALAMVVRVMNFFFVIGILRSGGDTLYALIIDLGTVWVIGIPMAFLGAQIFGLPIYFVLAMVYVEEFVKLFFNIHRYRKRKWVHRLV